MPRELAVVFQYPMYLYLTGSNILYCKVSAVNVRCLYHRQSGAGLEYKICASRHQWSIASLR